MGIYSVTKYTRTARLENKIIDDYEGFSKFDRARDKHSKPEAVISKYNQP